MTIKNCLRFTLPFVALFAFAGIASAQATGAAPTLEMTANVVTAMQLTISTDTANAGAVVTPGAANEFSVDLGEVNGLGVGSPTVAGVSVDSDSSGATYSTPINLTPSFSGFAIGEKATIKRMAGTSGDESDAREGATAATMATLPVSFTTAVSGKDDASLNTRYVGFFIDHARIAGDVTATVIYSITVL